MCLDTIASFNFSVYDNDNEALEYHDGDDDNDDDDDDDDDDDGGGGGGGGGV